MTHTKTNKVNRTRKNIVKHANTKSKTHTLTRTHTATHTHTHTTVRSIGLPCDISNGVTSTAKHEHRNAKAFDKRYAFAVAFDTEVEAPKTIAPERISAALKRGKTVS